MIKSFADINTEKVWKQQWVKSFPREAQRIGLRTLLLHRAVTSGYHQATALKSSPATERVNGVFVLMTSIEFVLDGITVKLLI